MDAHLELLSQCFVDKLSLSPEARRAAEAKLAELSKQPNFALAVLNLVALQNAGDAIRQAAAVNFKNHLRSHWSPWPGSPAAPIPDSEKQQIKSVIVSLMLTSPARIQSQLSEALTIIGADDFPQQWPGLLPELVASLETKMLANDYVSINGILQTANSVFKKFRYHLKTNELRLDLKHCLDAFGNLLLRVFQHTAGLVDSAAAVGAAANADSLKLLFESQSLCCRLFYSLNFQKIPKFFEDHMKEWMTEFRKYLSASYPAVEGEPNGLALVDDVRVAVCDNISLYVEKHDKEFREFLDGFLLAVCELLLSVSKSYSRDRLAVAAMKFLMTVSFSVHHTLLLGKDVQIQGICQGIVIPNVRLWDEDEELFEKNYVEFIRRDMEGSDLGTRRGIACELLKAIAMYYRQTLRRIVSVEIQNLSRSFAANPVENWKDKDCAIYLVVSLAMKKPGSIFVLTNLVDVKSFFSTLIVPELQSPDKNAFPMIKAAALKFLTTFMSQLPKDFVVTLLTDLVPFLAAESNVVHSYAASCFEKLLLVKGGSGRARYTSGDLAPVLVDLLTKLFEALMLPESEENQYVMKCIMRVVGVAEINNEVAGLCLSGLTLVMVKVCKNPKSPTFNYYLFESVACLVRRACERDSSLVSALENSLFPSIQTILAEDITEFLPYAFQLLAQLVELSRFPLSPSYLQSFTILLSPESWKRNSNVPALVRLLQAFLRTAPQIVSQEGRLNQVHEIFCKLVSVPSTDEQGFYLLNTAIRYLDYRTIAPLMPRIWNALFIRLNDRHTVRFVKSFVILMSLFSIKHTTLHLIITMDSVDSVQPYMFFAILEKFWIPTLKLIRGHIVVKLAAVAATRLICVYPNLFKDPAAARHWGKMLDSIITLLSQPEVESDEEEPDVPDITETVGGYTVSFTRLYNIAGKEEQDPLKEISDPKEFLAASLVRLSACDPGRYPQIIAENLDPENQSALLELCRAYNCSIV